MQSTPTAGLPKDSSTTAIRDMRDARDQTFAWEVERHMPILFTRTITAVLSLACAGLLLPAVAGAASTRTHVATASWGQQADRAQAHSAQQECADADLAADGSQRRRASAPRSSACTTRSAPSAGCRRCARTPACAPRPSGHTQDMVSRSFFDHVSPERLDDGRPDPGRPLHEPQREAWSLGENIAWGSGSLATPRAVVRTWMSSAGSPREHPQARLPRDRHRRRRRHPLRPLARRHVHHRLRRPPLIAGGAGVLACAAAWPTSSPSARSTTTSTPSAACRPSPRRPTT